MAEWSNAAVLKTVEGKLSGGSNPSPCAKRELYELWISMVRTFCFSELLGRENYASITGILNQVKQKEIEIKVFYKTVKLTVLFL